MVRLSHCSSLLLGALFASIAAAKVVQFNIVNADLAPDGFTRPMVTVNGVFPGTPIFANKGDVLQVNVSNQLTDPTMRRSTSIHWHGLFEAKAAQDDGPAFVTQCPISPGHSYLYNIALGSQTGTYWYHSHLSTQYADGLRGAIVIYGKSLFKFSNFPLISVSSHLNSDPQDPNKNFYDVDDETTVITLADHFHTSAETLTDVFMSPHGAEPVPDSITINGVGRYVNGTQTTRSVFNIASNTRYRFRVINMSASATYNFSIQGHPMTIIEADGISVQPRTADNFIIWPGQRYSVVVQANQPVANYWIRSPVVGGVIGTNATYNGSDVFAVLRYQGAPIAEPTTAPGTASGTAFSQLQLVPLVNPGAPGGSAPPDRAIALSIGRTTTADGIVAWSFNGVPYIPPNLPTLLEILSSGFTQESNFTASEQTFVLQPNQIIQLNITAGGHPIHLHGHAFDVLSYNGSPMNFANPPRRDVVDATGGVVIRFKTDNPGPWFLHCHIEWHLQAGLAAVFAEAPDAIRTTITPDADWYQLCPIYDALDPSLQ